MSDNELRNLDAEIHRLVFGKTAEWIAAEPFVMEKQDDNVFGFSCNFGGAVFTADRDWLVNDYLDPDENREVPYYTTDPAAACLVAAKAGCGVQPHGFREVNGVRVPNGWEAWVLSWGQQCHTTRAATQAEAICRAALKAIAAVVA